MTPEAQLNLSPAQVLAEESARVFMARVYRWMTAGLLVRRPAAAGLLWIRRFRGHNW